MNRNILIGLALCAAVVLVIGSCDNKHEVPLAPPRLQPPAQVPPPMPVPGMPPIPGAPGMQPPSVASPLAPVPEPPLPRTELIPIADATEEPKPNRPGKGGGTGICKLRGPETPGDELLGNYMCEINLKNMPFGLKPPPTGCIIKRKADGSLVVKPAGSGDSKFRGPVSETKVGGFRVDGKYKFGGNKLSIGACMRAQGVGKYKGSGSGVLNGDKKNRVKYTLIMTRQ